jgi:predicted NBD/HSP70 family sugar kinase
MMKNTNNAPLPARDLMKATNRINTLHAIRTAGTISRSDLAGITGLSHSSITGLTSELIKEGLVLEKATAGHDSGRPPIMLTINPAGAHVVGVNMSIAKISSVIINLEATVLARHILPLHRSNFTMEEIVDLIVQSIYTCIWQANFSKDQISGVGLGVPGLVNYRTGKISFLPNYDWKNVDLRSLVEEKLNHQTYIENSSNTLALAEHWFGEGKGIRNFLVVTIENGVGLGIFVEGNLYRGHDGIAGEFGHLTIDPQGPKCRCGKQGCIEAYVGLISIIDAARQLSQQGKWQPKYEEKITFEQVVAGAREGVVPLKSIFADAGRYLALGISHLINLYNPSKIIITGKGVQSGPLLFEPFYKYLPKYISNKFGWDESRIFVQQWTDMDWARGAGALVLQELFKSPVAYADMEISALQNSDSRVGMNNHLNSTLSH